MADERKGGHEQAGAGPGEHLGTTNLLKRPVDQFYAGISDPTRRLTIAAYEGDTAHAIAAIRAGADVNAIHEGTGLPVIHLAAGGGHTALVEHILKIARCDLTVRDRHGRLASDCAAYSARDFEMAELLAEEEGYQFRKAGKDPRRGKGA